jgi:hypothetical protein
MEGRAAGKVERVKRRSESKTREYGQSLSSCKFQSLQRVHPGMADKLLV